MASGRIQNSKEIVSYFGDILTNVYGSVTLRPTISYIVVNNRVVQISVILDGNENVTPPTGTELFRVPDYLKPKAPARLTVFCSGEIGTYYSVEIGTDGKCKNGWTFPIGNGKRYILYGTYILN